MPAHQRGCPASAQTAAPIENSDIAGTPIAPAYYLMFGAAAGLLSALFLRERAGDTELLAADAMVGA